MRLEMYICIFGIAGTPILMMYTKGLRMNAKEHHTVHMKVKRYSDFWRKGNAFVDAVNGKILASLAATVDPMVGKEVHSGPS
jgi:hypothetical protein